MSASVGLRFRTVTKKYYNTLRPGPADCAKVGVVKLTDPTEKDGEEGELNEPSGSLVHPRSGVEPKIHSMRPTEVFPCNGVSNPPT